jgi:hypothetical protein
MMPLILSYIYWIMAGLTVVYCHILCHLIINRLRFSYAKPNDNGFLEYMVYCSGYIVSEVDLLLLPSYMSASSQPWVTIYRGLSAPVIENYLVR